MPKAKKIDLLEDSKAAPPKPDDLKALASMARHQFKIATDIVKAEEKLKDLKQKFQQVSMTDIPDLMDKIGIEEFKLKGGFKLTIKKAVFVNISKDNQPKAHAWLRKKGFGDIIKTEAKVIFGKGEEEKVKVFNRIFAQRKLLRDLDYDLSDSIHSQTLKAFVKEQRAKGVSFPDTFNIHEAKQTIIVKGK